MEKQYCYGCGHSLQSISEEKLGYIASTVQKAEEIYCKRCYNMIFRNETPKVFLDNEDYWNLFNDIVNENQLYVLVIDVFNIEGSLINEMIEKLKNKKVLIAINKRDLLPKLIKDNKIYKYLKNHPKLKNIEIIDLLVVSAQKKYNIDILLDKINHYKIGDTYLIGLANVGKSSLINALINSVMKESKEYISTSYYGGTTLGLIKIPFGDGSDLVDTPGIVSDEQIYFNSNNKVLKQIVPQKEIRPKTYQLENNQSLFITGFLQMDYISGKKQGFTVYVANQILPHRTALKNAKDFRNDHLGKDIIVPPYELDLENIDFIEHVLKIKGKNVDIVVNDLCFINLKEVREEIEIKITIPNFFNYYIREGLI